MNNFFYSIIFLSSEITSSQKLRFLKELIAYDFNSYIYESNAYEKSDIILKDYFGDSQFSMRYKNEDVALSCDVGRDYLGYHIDGGSEDSKIIIKISDLIPSIFDQMIFSFIQFRGESPTSLEKHVKSNSLYWLFSINYFGAPFIEKYGVKFFQKFPAENVEFIGERVVKIELTSDLFKPISAQRKTEIENYLVANGIKNFEFYDYKKHFID